MTIVSRNIHSSTIQVSINIDTNLKDFNFNVIARYNDTNSKSLQLYYFNNYIPPEPIPLSIEYNADGSN
jgi:hypothetical protein